MAIPCLSALDYGNGDSVQYTYDDHGRLVTQTYEDGDSLYHKYDNSGNLASVWDSATARTTYYYYDLTDRMMKYVEKGDDGYCHSVGYEYNKLNNLTQQVETINGTNHTTSYSYDDDNRVETVTTGGVTVTYTYDDLGRVSKQETRNGDTLILTEEFTYTAPEDGKTSAQIATYDVTSGEYQSGYTYTYDGNGNITKISELVYGTAGTYSLNTFYTYDSANQLIKERYPMAGYTYQWVYDDAGNILSRYEKGSAYGGFERTVSYGYSDSQWGDLLTSYNGQSIESDRLGNIVNDADWTYTWEHGRQLKSMFDGTATWSYEYNADGLRTKKTNGTDTYTYIYNGSQLTQMTKGTDTLYFTYDASGTPLTLIHNGTTYYYVTNIQGDVVGILNGAGESLVTYRYEASGKWLAQSGTEKDGLGALNPLRYRGYVYDTETGLYYLQSRYYNPELGRFISADAFIATGQGILGNNMFAYCGNNPIKHYDSNGKWTMGISFGANATIGIGVSVSIGVYWDAEGNIELQWSYSVPTVDDTAMVGAVDAGVGFSLQYTDRQSIYDLYGPATYIGASGGPWWYIGADLITFSDASDLGNETNGFQITGGIGIGLDVHVAETYTKPILRNNINTTATDAIDANPSIAPKSVQLSPISKCSYRRIINRRNIPAPGLVLPIIRR